MNKGQNVSWSGSGVKPGSVNWGGEPVSVIYDVLNLVRLNVDVYHNARVCGDWLIREHTLEATCFHMPTQGDCLLQVPGEGDWHLQEGDVVIFPKELAHTMKPVQPLVGPQQHLQIADAQSLKGTSMLCGSIHFQHQSGQQLMQLLPPVLIVKAESARQWLGPLKQLIVAESVSGIAINSPVLNRLCELLVAYAIRCFAENGQHDQGILALFAHPKLYKAVQAMHLQPALSWQLASLAKEAGMSRTRFSELFTKTAGMTATAYLSWWRMQLAWSELQQGASVAAVAEQVGYRSEAAFSRAFKKHFGQTVGEVRLMAR